MTGWELRAWWLRLPVLLALLAPALHAGTPSTTVLAGAVALVAAALAVRVPPLPASAPASGTRIRAWLRADGTIARAEEPDRRGRPRPRAPGRRPAASER